MFSERGASNQDGMEEELILNSKPIRIRVEARCSNKEGVPAGIQIGRGF